MMFILIYSPLLLFPSLGYSLKLTKGLGNWFSFYSNFHYLRQCNYQVYDPSNIIVFNTLVNFLNCNRLFPCRTPEPYHQTKFLQFRNDKCQYSTSIFQCFHTFIAFFDKLLNVCIYLKKKKTCLEVRISGFSHCSSPDLSLHLPYKPDSMVSHLH